MAPRRCEVLVILLVISLLIDRAVILEATTDPNEVQALGTLYSSLNNPPQLSGWRSDGGDPCGDSWKGVSCDGSSITSIQLSGLGLNGTMGYLLSNLQSLKTLDLSNNYIHESIPYQLPPNLTYLNLASNNLSGGLAYSINNMVSLTFLNVSHNYLSQSIQDIFTNLQDLSILDLSFNNFTGDLPNSIGLLSNLSSLYLQDNQLTGAVNVLASLDLNDLNIANNHFSGWIPPELRSIPDLVVVGNSFANSPAPPPPPFMPPPPRRPHRTRNQTHAHTNTTKGPNITNILPSQPVQGSNKRWSAGAIIGTVIGSLFVLIFATLVAILCINKNRKHKQDSSKRAMDLPRTPSALADRGTKREMPEQKLKSPPMASLKPPPSEKLVMENIYGRDRSMKKPKLPITATSYSVATLQSATNSFNQEFLIGEGSLGRVYRAEFPNGKVLAIKKIDSAALSLQEEDNFLEAVSNMSRLRHPNITTLVGYCVEHGQRLLVYEYIGNGTLHDMLHFTDDSSTILTWNQRVKIALGVARALEYLHEVCLPSVVHRNLKSANVLLDEELNPHLSDCGLATLTPNTERPVSTQMVGSFGYSAPEFAMSGIYTMKSDVYSFGVVMLEIVTGRKPLDSSRIRSEQSLVRWATPQLHDIDALAKMVDPALNGMYPAKSLSRFADIIALCVQPEPEFRPPMSEVVQALVRLVQRASIVRRRSGDEMGYSYRTPDNEAPTDLSF